MRLLIPLGLTILAAACGEAGTTQLLQKVHRDGGPNGEDGFDLPDLPPIDFGTFDIGPNRGVAQLVTRFVEFGTRVPGSQTRAVVTLLGDPQLFSEVRVLGLQGPFAEFFSLGNVRNGETISLPAGQTFDIEVLYEPVFAGRAGASLELDLCNAGCFVSVSLQGVAVDSGIQCPPMMFTTFPGMCETRSERCVSVVDDVLVTVAEPTITPAGEPFTLGSVLPRFIPPHNSFELVIHYCPLDANPHRATLNMRHEADTQIAPGGSSVNVDLFAGPGMGQCSLSFDPSLDFGTLATGNQSVRSLIISNFGFGPCRLTFLGLTGTSTSGVFQQIDPPSGASELLPPGAQRAIVIGFAPNIPGTYFDQVQIMSDDPFNPVIFIPISGQASPPQQGGFRIEIVPTMPQLTPGARLFFMPNDDDGSTTVPIPFPFTFLGRSVTQVFVSTNGFITFDPQGAANLRGEPIPSPNPPNSVIAFWWDDLHPFRPGTMGVVTSFVNGVAPSRTLSITYRSVVPFSGSQTVQINGSIRLQEQSGIIEVEYGQMTDPMNAFFAATVGWEGPFGTTGADALGCSPNCTAAAWPVNMMIRYIPVP